MVEQSQIDAVREACERTLRTNWIEGVRESDRVPFAYTQPSPGHYPWQWYWDSCFTAIAWRRFDPARARAELSSLLAAQRADGFIGHTIFWTGAPRLARRFTYNIVSRADGMTASIQPPVLAWAWRIAVGDPASGDPRGSGLDDPAAGQAIARHHRWLEKHRDLDGDGLLWIVQPDESGLDDSPQFDAIWGRRAHGTPGFFALVRRNRRLGYDLRRIVDAGGPVCCEVMTNVLWSLSRMALGEPSLTPVIVERMYDEATGLFTALARPAPRRRLALTWTALAPLALPDLPEEIGRRLVEEHLLDPRRFWLGVPPTSVSATDPSFSLNDTVLPGLRRYWRGPTWVNAAWLVWLGLVRLGYDDHAGELARRIAAAVVTSGLREYYDPYTGAGMGAKSFGWSTLAIELTEPDSRAGSSYLKS